jgi:large conductance mechanosensitive channel
MKNFLNDFKAFLMKGNLVVLAVAFLMATAFAPVVQSFANDVVMQIVAGIFGQPDFAAVGFDVGDAFVSIGSVINALIGFVIIAFVCFILMKAYEASQKKQEEEAAGPTEVELLTEIRDSLRNR